MAASLNLKWRLGDMKPAAVLAIVTRLIVDAHFFFKISLIVFCHVVFGYGKKSWSACLNRDAIFSGYPMISQAMHNYTFNVSSIRKYQHTFFG